MFGLCCNLGQQYGGVYYRTWIVKLIILSVRSWSHCYRLARWLCTRRETTHLRQRGQLLFSNPASREPLARGRPTLRWPPSTCEVGWLLSPVTDSQREATVAWRGGEVQGGSAWACKSTSTALSCPPPPLDSPEQGGKTAGAYIVTWAFLTDPPLASVLGVPSPSTKHPSCSDTWNSHHPHFEELTDVLVIMGTKATPLLKAS